MTGPMEIPTDQLMPARLMSPTWCASLVNANYSSHGQVSLRRIIDVDSTELECVRGQNAKGEIRYFPGVGSALAQSGKAVMRFRPRSNHNWKRCCPDDARIIG
jgi:hypothetical protein